MRAFLYALVIHIIFGSLLGINLWFQPKAIIPKPASPVEAKVIDIGPIEEKKRKEAEIKKKAAAEKKKKAEAEKKRKEAEKKKKAAAEKKKKAEAEKLAAEKKKKAEADKLAAEKAAVEAQKAQDKSDAESAFGAVTWAIQEQVRNNWSGQTSNFTGLSVSFMVKVDRKGNVISVKMTKSSGNARLDESAENAIYKASPLPIPGESRFYEYLKEFNFVFMP